VQQILEHLGTAVAALSGVLAARGKQIDLFGVIVLALVTATGGGTLRDVILKLDVFWVANPTFIVTIVITAVAAFVVARFWALPEPALLLADAGGLAFFTILGTEKSLLAKNSEVVAVVFGVMTGVAGGIARDVLLGQIPLVFRRTTYWYATAALIGAIFFVALRDRLDPSILGPCAIAVIFAVRIVSIWWRLHLPDFEAAEPREP
jgi:uncharacterized membrane protein YeiH